MIPLARTVWFHLGRTWTAHFVEAVATLTLLDALLVSSKTLTTLETMPNAHTARVCVAGLG